MHRPPALPDDSRTLRWPFFDDAHRQLRAALQQWASTHLQDVSHEAEHVDATCVDLVQRLGADGWLRHAIAGTAYGASHEVIDTRSLCLLRETLAWHHGLADFAFAMQGLGSGAISLFGTPAQKAQYLPRVAKGEAIAAFALSETTAGSDVAAMQCSARREGDHWVIDGEKTWISNGGIADFYVVFVRDASGGTVRGTKNIHALIVDAQTPGLSVAERIEVVAPHPLARLKFDHVRVPAHQLLGEAGQGFKVAMGTLDVFRTSVAAAALGFGQRALDDTLRHVRQRPMAGQMLADLQLTQAKLAEMAMLLDGARLQTYRAAWLRDQGERITQEAAMAKFAATEGAQRVIDMAVQLHGGLGVTKGCTVESLYREIRALRIYEGASEVQQLIIARALLQP
ncbi:MAG: hypothetical protein RLZ36_523 [Pseudomonadota bacterium]|jgi:alkylation response protein AidB-like acyl-CoA dehydrogenase